VGPSAGAVLQRRFAGKLVRESVALRHQGGVVARSGRERVVPAQRLQALCSALAIHGVEQGALDVVGRLLLRVHGDEQRRENRED
jgi:hypothetical protein